MKSFPFLSVTEYAAAHGVSAASVYRMIAAGEISAKRFGRQYFISEASTMDVRGRR